MQTLRAIYNAMTFHSKTPFPGYSSISRQVNMFDGAHCQINELFERRK